MKKSKRTKRKSDLAFVVAIKMADQTRLFEFKTVLHRQQFILELVKSNPRVQFASTTIKRRGAT